MGAALSRDAFVPATREGELLAEAQRAEQMLASGKRHPDLLALVGWHREFSGDLEGSEGLWREALELAPTDPTLLTALGAIIRKRGRLSEALPLLDDAVARAPNYPTAWLERGYACHVGGALEDAAESYHKAARLDPQSAAALAGFAAVAALLGYPVATRSFGARALAIDPRNPIAVCAIASVDIEDREWERAATSLTALLAGEVRPENRIEALVLLGKARDRLASPDTAFAAFAESNATFANLYSTHFSGSSHRAVVEMTTQAVAGIPVESWVAPASGTAPTKTHGFLLGYPRSGTTLVENILATAPGVVAVEERPTLHDAAQEFLTDAEGIERLADIDEAEAEAHRATYWRKVAAMDVALPAETFIDMDPLGSIRLPVIAKLFPKAKIVVQRRDPRDVVWSCFRTGFAPSAAYYEFTDLERTARHYDATMKLLELSLERLPLDVHVLRYENLVADFDTTTTALCEFLGIEWTPELRSFDKTSRQRGVTTASVTQVRRGLYDGSGQWRPYAAHMASVLPILQPWVERFGYAD